jgi:hypothetical protein
MRRTILANELYEASAVQLEHLAVTLAPHRGRARLACEESHFADRLTARDGRQARLPEVSGCGTENTEPAVTDHVKGVGRIILAEQDAAVRQAYWFQVCGQLRQRHAIQARKDLDFTKEVSVFRDASPVRERTLPASEVNTATAREWLDPGLPQKVAYRTVGGRLPSGSAATIQQAWTELRHKRRRSLHSHPAPLDQRCAFPK